MYIKETKKIINRIVEIAENGAVNHEIQNNVIAQVGGVHNLVIDDVERFKNTAKGIAKGCADLGKSITFDEAMVKTAVATLLKDEEFENEQTPLVLAQQLEKTTQYLKIQDFRDDPYIKNIKIKDTTVGDLKLFTDKLPALTFITINSLLFKKSMYALPQIGFFDEELAYPMIKKIGAQDLYAVGPAEINTCKAAISNAKGKVLNLGLSLGYFAYMASLKDDVEKVTIVENDKDLIELFKQTILPQFEHPEKIEIVQKDSFEYLDGLQDKTFDYCFIDILKDEQEYLTYLKLKKLCHKFKKMQVCFKHENDIGIQLSNFVYIQMVNDCSRLMESFSQTEPPQLEGIDLEIFNIIKKAYSKVKITDSSDIDHYLHPKTIIKML